MPAAAWEFRSSRFSATRLAREPGRRDRRRPVRGGHRLARPQLDGAGLRRHQGRRGRHQGVRGRLPGFDADRLRRADHARGLCGDDGRAGALDRGLVAVAGCPVRIVLLHYAPTDSTIEGEPPGSGPSSSDRLGRPIADHLPDLVLHGHGHAGTYEGFVGAVPVYNVSLPVMGQDFAVFELGDGTVRDVSSRPTTGRLSAERRFIERSLDHPHRHPGSRAAGLLLARLLVGPTHVEQAAWPLPGGRRSGTVCRCTCPRSFGVPMRAESLPRLGGMARPTAWSSSASATGRSPAATGSSSRADAVATGIARPGSARTRPCAAGHVGRAALPKERVAKKRRRRILLLAIFAPLRSSSSPRRSPDRLGGGHRRRSFCGSSAGGR